MKSKDYYWLYINATTVRVTGPKKMGYNKRENIEWTSKFNLIRNVCRENKLREFYLKLIHRLTVTKKELCTYGLEDVNNCFNCERLEWITHTSVECNSSLKTFSDKIIHWFNIKYHSTYSPTPIEKLFGIVTNDDENDYSAKIKFLPIICKILLIQSENTLRAMQLRPFYLNNGTKDLYWKLYTEKVNGVKMF